MYDKHYKINCFIRFSVKKKFTNNKEQKSTLSKCGNIAAIKLFDINQEHQHSFTLHWDSDTLYGVKRFYYLDGHANVFFLFAENKHIHWTD